MQQLLQIGNVGQAHNVQQTFAGVVMRKGAESRDEFVAKRSKHDGNDSRVINCCVSPRRGGRSCLVVLIIVGVIAYLVICVLEKNFLYHYFLTKRLSCVKKKQFYIKINVFHDFS